MRGESKKNEVHDPASLSQCSQHSPCPQEQRGHSRIPHLPSAGSNAPKSILKRAANQHALPEHRQPPLQTIPPRHISASNVKTTSASPAAITEFGATLQNEGSVGAKPSVGFSSRDAIAIIGDTSDGGTPEAENGNKRHNLLAPLRRAPIAAIVSPIRQLAPTTEGTVPEPDIAEEPSTSITTASDILEEGILDESTEDDPSSMENSITTMPSEGSVIPPIGRWWSGKSTKFVLHCDKRGCGGHGSAEGMHHKLMSSNNNYATPTQRKNKEISRLRQELTCQNELRDKDGHLSELKRRLGEIEVMLESGQIPNDAICSLRGEREKEQKEYKEERRLLIDRYEMRIRQLTQDTVDARTEAATRARQLERLNALLNVERADRSTMTVAEEADGEEMSPGGSHLQLHASASAPTSPSMGYHHPANQPVLQQHSMTIALSQEAMTQLEAYRNEALIWRTKAAQLEIVIKDLLLKEERNAQNYAVELSRRGDEMQELKETVRKLSAAPPVLTYAPQEENALDVNAPMECQLSSCKDRNRELVKENERLLQNIRDQEAVIDALESELKRQKEDYANKSEKLEELHAQYGELAKIAEERKAECKATYMTLERVQSENGKLNQAVSYLEGRHQVYQNVILAHGLVIHDESTDKWRHGFMDPRYSIYRMREVQTDLTGSELAANENGFVELQNRLQHAEAEFDESSRCMRNKFTEVEESLHLKTQLVEQLARQLEQSAANAQTSDEHRQRERELYQMRIDELGSVAERVPVLEDEMARAREAKSQLEINFRKTTEAFDGHLDTALKETMKQQRDLEGYWQRRVENVEESRKNAMSYAEKLQKEISEMKLHHSLEKTDLERRLTSAIAHVELLNSKVNFPHREVGCMARPKATSKYVSCKPNQRHKFTGITRGDLPDVELNQCKVDYMLAKRRIEELEAKLRRHAPHALQEDNVRAGSMERAFDRAYFNRGTGHVQFSQLEKTTHLRVLADENGEKLSIASSPGIDLASDFHFKHSPAPAPDNEDWKYLRLEAGLNRLKKSNGKLMGENFFLGERVAQLESEMRLRGLEIPALPHFLPVRDKEAVTEEKVNMKGRRSMRRASSFSLEHKRYGVVPAEPASATKQLKKLRSRLGALKHKAAGEGGEEEFHHICDTLMEIVENEEGQADLALRAVPRELFVEVRNENRMLLDQLGEVRGALGRAELELAIYRTEPREEARTRWIDRRMPRSRSSEEITLVSTKELRRWRDNCGVLFREVNHLRLALDASEKQKDSYRNQLYIIKGEYVMSRCQAIADAEEASDRHSSGALQRRHSQPKIQCWRGEVWTGVNFSDITSRKRRNSFSLDARHQPLRGEQPSDSYQMRTLVVTTQGGSRDRRRIMDDRDDPSVFEMPGERKRLHVMQETPIEKELHIVQEALHAQSSAMKRKNRELEERLAELERKSRSLAKEDDEAVRVSAEKRVGSLAAENEMLQTENAYYEKKIRSLQEDQEKMNLIMFRKGQQMATAASREEVDAATEGRVMLRFLHDAFYYYLLNKGSARDHLQAIMTMLDFSTEQKDEVLKRRGPSR